MEVIHVGLYGGKGIFGGKETPLRAEVVSCDKCNECSYYKNAQCLNVTSPFSNRCKYGNVNIAQGYTSRANKYYEFKYKYEKHEKYAKLSHPPQKLGVIGDVIVFPYPLVYIKNEVTGEYTIHDPGFSSSIAFINKDKFTVDFINKLCTFRPQAMMGGSIVQYQQEIVPKFIAHLKEVLPDLYFEFTKKYPQYIKDVDYIGRKALLKTINPSDVCYKSANYPEFNSTWHWDGEFITYKKGFVSDLKVTDNYEIVEVKIRPTDKSITKIVNNDQVNGETVFLD
jgi:hypothetical protein